MISEAQKKQIEYNDKGIENYKRNKAIQISIEQKEYDAIIKRRWMKLPKIPQEKKLFLCSERRYIYLKDITDELIDKEIEFGFNYEGVY